MQSSKVTPAFLDSFILTSTLHAARREPMLEKYAAW